MSKILAMTLPDAERLSEPLEAEGHPSTYALLCAIVDAENADICNDVFMQGPHAERVAAAAEERGIPHQFH